MEINKLIEQTEKRINEISEMRNPLKKAEAAERVVFQTVEIIKALSANLDALNQRTGLYLHENEKGVSQWRAR